MVQAPFKQSCEDTRISYHCNFAITRDQAQHCKHAQINHCRQPPTRFHLRTHLSISSSKAPAKSCRARPQRAAARWRKHKSRILNMIPVNVELRPLALAKLRLVFQELRAHLGIPVAGRKTQNGVCQNTPLSELALPRNTGPQRMPP